ncbi:MAG TPA: PHP domain-containing protein [Sedimentibacter sp.]|jgi:predicted metal-dependent phosphoesterase TrpH|nr:PHP domain-containing protein [Bacillota bacterium]HQO95999.1 PHP domain-containing protein [Sedimentibacter sp.]HRS22408.1 PHP domain-containing protein [Clostridia bacterium]HQE67549.1 PHP domain-containing protein [Bacillota bacterium]HQI15388.1 PHP domain-containing protein [Bacillota bacterium]
MLKADLHIHTTASDGLLSPEKVVRWASAKRLTAIGITDHDTVKGISPAMKASSKYGVEIVPGIELSTIFEEEEIHVLGYFIDYNSQWLADTLKKIQNSRYERAGKIVGKLNDLGIDITLEQVKGIADDAAMGRPHIARAMIDKGYISNIREAFNEYIGKDRPAYVERYKLTCKEAIDMIKNLGGISVLAHPGLINNKDNIGKIIDLGIDGIEVYHSKHDDETVRNILAVAHSRNLLITGGSDCHGMKLNNEPILGNYSIDYKYVQMLKEALNKK